MAERIQRLNGKGLPVFRPQTVVLGILIVLGSGLIGRAEPITYDFAGNFDQPMNGTTQFSGSFTFNVNPTPSNFGTIGIIQDTISKVGSVSVAQPAAYSFSPLPSYVPGPAPIAEYGNDVSLTVNMGGQTIHYTNTTQNPYFATFSAWVMNLSRRSPHPGSLTTS